MIFFKNNSSKTTVDVIKEVIPNIYINKTAIHKMRMFIEECTDEVGWLGTVKREGKNFLIDDVLLFDQEVHATTTEITPEGLSSFGEEILNKPGGVDLWNDIKLWGHSHVNMSTSPSGQDNSQMVTFQDCGHDWFIRIIGNKKGEIKIDLYMYDLGIVYEDLPWRQVVSNEEIEIENQISLLREKLEKIDEEYIKSIEFSVKNDIKQKVRKKTYVTRGTQSSAYGYSPYFDSRNYQSYQKKTIEEVGGKTFGGYDFIPDADWFDEEMEDMDDYQAIQKNLTHQNNLEIGIDADWFLEGMAMAEDVATARAEIIAWGYEDVYSDKEIRDLMRYSKMFVEEVY